MIRFFLLILMSISLSVTMSAQKSNWQKLQKAKKLQAPYLKKSTSTDDRAAYLLDSVKVYLHEAGDSTLFTEVKTKYNPNGTAKEQGTYFSIPGFFELWFQNNIFYSNTKPLLSNYTDTYVSQDGIDFLKVGVDSFFYDTKDRVNLVRSRDSDTKELVAYTINKYKTNFNTADTTRSYTFNDNTGNLEPNEFTFNVIDSKGNTTSTIESKENSITNEFGLSSKSEFKYNAKNAVTEQANFLWNTDNKVWFPDFLTVTNYKADGKVNYSLGFSEYDESSKTWAVKDSSFTIYDNKGNATAVNIYLYDNDTKKYVLVSKTALKYDANNNQTYSVSFEANEGNPTAFAKSTSILQWWSFYKDAVGVKEIFSKEHQLITANPMSDNQEVMLKSNVDGNYILEAYDITGKVVNRQIIRNNQSVNVQLPTSGNYLLLLSDKHQKPLAMKKVVKN